MIRTLRVSLVAAAALVTGLLVNRSLHTAPAQSSDSEARTGSVQLQALREAGI